MSAAEAEDLRKRKKIKQERYAQFIKVGRIGYRLYRLRIKTNGYHTSSGKFQDRPAKLSKVQWRRIIHNDIAEEIGVLRPYVELAISKFRKELFAKIKTRRERAIIQLYHEGLKNHEIADRVSVSSTTVERYLNAYRNAQTEESN